MTTKDRFVKYLKFKGLGQTAFEESAGLSRGSIAQKTGFNANSIEKIAIACPDLNLDWLITGKGDMLKQPLPSSLSMESSIGVGHIGDHSSPIIQNQAHSQSSSDKKNDPLIFENRALQFEVEQLKKDNSKLKEDVDFFKKQIEELKLQNQDLQNRLLEEKDRFISYITQNKS